MPALCSCRWSARAIRSCDGSTIRIVNRDSATCSGDLAWVELRNAEEPDRRPSGAAIPGPSPGFRGRPAPRRSSAVAIDRAVQRSPERPVSQAGLLDVQQHHERVGALEGEHLGRTRWLERRQAHRSRPRTACRGCPRSRSAHAARTEGYDFTTIRSMKGLPPWYRRFARISSSSPCPLGCRERSSPAPRRTWRLDRRIRDSPPGSWSAVAGDGTRLRIRRSVDVDDVARKTVRGAAAARFSSTSRTDGAVTGVPSWNVTPWRRRRVRVAFRRRTPTNSLPAMVPSRPSLGEREQRLRRRC